MKIITSSLRLVAAAAGVCLLAGSLTPVLAQGPGSGGPTPATPAATETPIDGGASLLLAAGAAYGLKRLRNARRSKAK
ncbi:PID-CTERM protein-sorting domain-containing protein [Hymenobacter glaciei]